MEVKLTTEKKEFGRAEHKTVLKNFFHQYKLLARANRLYIELLEEDVPNAIRVNLLAKIVYGEVGKKYGVKFAEEFGVLNWSTNSPWYSNHIIFSCAASHAYNPLLRSEIV